MVSKEIWEFLGNKGENISDEFARYVFTQFVKSLPWYYRSNKLIPFGYLFWWFAQRKLANKETAKKFIKVWQELDLIVFVPYHGIKIDWEKIGKEVLKK